MGDPVVSISLAIAVADYSAESLQKISVGG